MNERKLTTTALSQLASNTGLIGSISEYTPNVDQHTGHSNALIKFDNPKAQLVAKLMEWAANTDSGAVISKLHAMESSHDKILICDYVNEELGRRLREAHINYLDRVGNAYLNVPSIHVSIQGKVPADKVIAGKANRLFGEVGLKIVFALLSNRDLLNANYRQIANHSNVSMGAIGWALRELRSQAYIIESDRQVRWNDRPGLLKQWVEEYPTLKSKTQLGKFYTQDSLWWKNIELDKYGAVLGGEIAAQYYQRDLIPKAGCIYVGRNKQGSLIRDLQLVKADTLSPALKPNVEIRSKFWGEIEDTRGESAVGSGKTTSPLLTHADLMDSWDAESRKIAEDIAKLYLSS